MRHFLSRTALTLILAAGVAASGHAHGISLSDALAKAYENSDSLAVQRAALRRTDEGVASARAAKNPQLSGSASTQSTKVLSGGSTTNRTSVSITGSKLLYDGGQTEASIESARMSVLAGRQALITAEQNVLLGAVTSFMDLRRDRDALQLAENNVRVLREQLRAARDRFDVGEVTRTDVSQTEARLASAVSNLELARGNVRISEAAFAANIGVKPGHLHGPSNKLTLPESARAAENIAVKRHPRIVEAQFNVKSAQFDLEEANLNRSVSITGSLTGTVQRGSGTSGDADSVTARVQANVPLYSGGALDVARRGALAALDQAKAQVQLNAAVTRQNVKRAYAQWQTSRAAIQAVQQQIRSAEVAFEGVQEEAKLGARTTLDALDAEQELLSARSNLISATRNEIVAAYSVLSEMGLLTVDYLKLGVKQYDPNVNYSKTNAASKLGNKRLKLLKKLENR